MFMMYDVWKLRNLSKMKNIFQEKADHFMYAGCLLLTKGMLINKNCINSLLNKNNIFSIENFNEFVESNIG